MNKCLECSEIGRHCYLPLVKACRLLEVSVSGFISSKTVHGWWSAAKQDLPTQELTDTEEIARLRRLLREREAEIAFLKNLWNPLGCQVG